MRVKKSKNKKQGFNNPDIVDADIVLDLGNTTWRMAFVKDGVIVDRVQVSPMKTMVTEDGHNEIKLFSESIAERAVYCCETDFPRKIIFASVADANITGNYIDLMTNVFPGSKILILTGDMPGLPLKFAPGITQKEKIGADRLANAMAAVAFYPGQPCVIADFGTALTVDGVNEKGEFVGGMILPGMATMLTTLHWRCRRLPDLQIPPVSFTKPYGQNTADAMLAGAEHGYRGLVRETVMTMQSALRENGHSCPFDGHANQTDKNVRSPLLLATGGMASRVAPASGLEFEILPDLTLLGIAQVLQGAPS